jgi:glycosyltransferase involved in cell wall biosynthesis
MGGSGSIRVCLGMPLFNKTSLLREALDSLQAQTYADFRLLVVDDSTDSEPGRILRSYAAQDPRIVYRANPTHKGMIDNWRACVQESGHPEYFAWVSDHDRWEPNWLESLVGALDANPQAVLAYPLTAHIEEDGSARKKKKVHYFSTVGMTRFERVKSVCRNARGLGKMVYGLYRVDALKAAGVFRHLLHPDGVLILELSLAGDFIQVPAKLWHRRKTADFRMTRQRMTLFGQKPPWYICLPWPVVNSCALLWNGCLRPDAGTWQSRMLGLYISLMYLRRWIGKIGEGTWIGSYHEWRHGKKPWMKKLKKAYRQPACNGSDDN